MITTVNQVSSAWFDNKLVRKSSVNLFGPPLCSVTSGAPLLVRDNSIISIIYWIRGNQIAMTSNAE